MINRFSIFFAIFFISNFIIAQNKENINSWAELKDFHSVMSQTFHPGEEGNFQPIKERAGEMLEKAKKLAESIIPSEFDTKIIKKSLKKLVKQSRNIDKLVKSNANDKAINNALVKTHDVFHQIVGLCTDEHQE